jgi:hypothetical protein
MSGMAHAQFHKNQRVYVRPVGTWALVERIVPHWTKGLEEPIRVFYDVGLGREFGAEELRAEATLSPMEEDGEPWRIQRAHNKWQSITETATHPYPGTYPVVVTGEADWGGWRVPGAEYALSPSRIEAQSRLIAASPRLAAIVKRLSAWAKDAPGEIPDDLLELLRQSREILAYIDETVE